MPSTSKENNTLEKTLFEIICLIIIMVMLHGMIQGFIIFELSFSTLIEFLLSFTAAIFFYLSRFKNLFHLLRVPLVIFTNVCLVFFWFSLSGYFGPTGIGAAAIGIISIILLPAKHKNLYLIINFLVLTALVLIQVNTDWVYTEPEDYTSLPYDYLVILLGLLLIVNYLKIEFDKERDIAQSQYHELNFLNKNLTKAIEDKQDTIRTLQSTQSKLIDSEKMASVGRLTAGLAHELNNPLNFIGGNVQPILNDLEEIKGCMSKEALEKNKAVFEEIEQLLDNVLTGSRRATEVITNLLNISPRGTDNNISIVPLNDLIRRTSLLLKNAHPDVSFTFELDEFVYASVNSIEINQVLLNILKNALDSLPHKRARIKMKLYKSGRKAVIEVCDNGKGIPEQFRTQIFEPFFTTKEEGKGTGLGLYISYGIIKKHEGEIIYIPLDKGSCFKITLPAIESV